MKSKKIQFSKNSPFNDLPFLPPPQDVETKAILKATINARTAITELKNKAVLLPKDDILIHNLSLVEAKDSSEIENIFTTHDKLYQADFLSEKDIDHNTKEVTRYRTALWRGMELVKKRGLSTNTYVEIVQIIKQNKAGMLLNILSASSGARCVHSCHSTIALLYSSCHRFLVRSLSP